jgi:hypothetical protein
MNSRQKIQIKKYNYKLVTVNYLVLRNASS